MSLSRHDLLSMLAKLGNCSPKSKHIRLLDRLLQGVTLKRELIFKNILTERESTCLLLAAKGLSIKAIADALGITEHTVKTHRENICRKLRCKNITQAVFEGMRYGYLE